MELVRTQWKFSQKLKLRTKTNTQYKHTAITCKHATNSINFDHCPNETTEVYLKFNFINDGREFGRTYYSSPFLLKTRKHISSSLHLRVTTIKSQDREKREIITARRHAVSITLCISSGWPARGLSRWVSARAFPAPRLRRRCCLGRGLVGSAAAAAS